MAPWMSYSSPSYLYSTSATLVPATLYPPTMSSYRDPLDLHTSATVPSATSRPFLRTPNPTLNSNNRVGPPKDHTHVKVEEKNQQEADSFLTTLSRPWPASQAREQSQRETDIFPKALSRPGLADRVNEEAKRNESQVRLSDDTLRTFAT
ncbi:hypothetical protein BDV10DRAFT_177431 [Aspergillus recurvatus]